MLQSCFQSQDRKYHKQLKSKLSNKPQDFYVCLHRQAELASALTWRTAKTWPHTMWGHERGTVAQVLPEPRGAARHNRGAHTHRHRHNLRCSLLLNSRGFFLNAGSTHRSPGCCRENTAHISHIWLKGVLTPEWGCSPQKKGMSYCSVLKRLLQHWFVQANYEIFLVP